MKNKINAQHGIATICYILAAINLCFLGSPSEDVYFNFLPLTPVSWAHDNMFTFMFIPSLILLILGYILDSNAQRLTLKHLA